MRDGQEDDEEEIEKGGLATAPPLLKKSKT